MTLEMDKWQAKCKTCSVKASSILRLLTWTMASRESQIMARSNKKWSWDFINALKTKATNNATMYMQKIDAELKVDAKTNKVSEGHKAGYRNMERKYSITSRIMTPLLTYFLLRNIGCCFEPLLSCRVNRWC